MASALPEAFTCPITSELMADPVTTADGFSYEREAIEKWLQDHTISPLTGAPLKHLELIPNMALRSAIQEAVDARPELKSLVYKPTPQAVAPSAVASAVAPVAHDPFPHAPVGLPVGQAVPIESGATANQSSGVAPLAAVWDAQSLHVAAISAHVAWTSMRQPGLELQVTTGDGGGARVTAQVGGEEGMTALVDRICSGSSAKLEGLCVTGLDAVGFGTMSETSTEGPAFARLIEALRPTARVYSLHALKELSVKALELSDATAVALASALQGHPKLAELELWNVGLDDDGAIAIARLATPQGNAALRRLNLGRNLMSGSGKEKIEQMVQGSSVQLRTY